MRPPMTLPEMLAEVRDLLRYGIHITPHNELHSEEGCEQLRLLLNRVLAHQGRTVMVTLDRVAMVVRLDPR